MSLYNNHNISACIITHGRDLKSLARAVDSVRSSCDEIIISANDNRQAVRDLFKNDNQVKVYLQEWEDDFGKARNECMSHAQGEWILTLDCDETLESEIEYLDDSFTAYMCRVWTDVQDEVIAYAEHSEFRIFKRGIQYTGKIHEQPSIPVGSKIARGAIAIRQYPITEGQAREKIKRNAEICLEDSANPMNDYLLCQCFALANDFEKLIYHSSKVLADKLISLSLKAQVCYWLGMNLIGQGLMADALNYFQASLIHEPNQVCSRYALLRYMIDNSLDPLQIAKLKNSISEVQGRGFSSMPVDFFLKKEFLQN